MTTGNLLFAYSLASLVLLLALPQMLHVTVMDARAISFAVTLVMFRLCPCKACWPKSHCAACLVHLWSLRPEATGLYAPSLVLKLYMQESMLRALGLYTSLCAPGLVFKTGLACVC